MALVAPLPNRTAPHTAALAFGRILFLLLLADIASTDGEKGNVAPLSSFASILARRATYPLAFHDEPVGGLSASGRDFPLRQPDSGDDANYQELERQ
jgi:hypothetical protein